MAGEEKKKLNTKNLYWFYTSQNLPDIAKPFICLIDNIKENKQTNKHQPPQNHKPLIKYNKWVIEQMTYTNQRKYFLVYTITLSVECHGTYYEI